MENFSLEQYLYGILVLWYLLLIDRKINRLYSMNLTVFVIELAL